jgi:hypothetical protein
VAHARIWQQSFDPLLTPGFRNYWKSHNFTQISDGLLDTILEFAGKLPSPHCEIFVGLLAGAANDVPPEATAYSARDARGMTIDNLLAADVVAANGTLLRTSEKDHPDLFWAIRGGGGNFGVVTQFEFKLHPLGPSVFAGLIVFPLREAKGVLTQYREFVESAPAKLSVWAVLRQAPPLPFLPQDVHGTEVVVLAVFFAGNARDGEQLIQPLRRFGNVLGEHLGPMLYTQGFVIDVHGRRRRRACRCGLRTELCAAARDQTALRSGEHLSPQPKYFCPPTGTREDRSAQKRVNPTKPLAIRRRRPDAGKLWKHKRQAGDSGWPLELLAICWGFWWPWAFLWRRRCSSPSNIAASDPRQRKSALSLLPWNRAEASNAKSLWHTFIDPPLLLRRRETSLGGCPGGVCSIEAQLGTATSRLQPTNRKSPQLTPGQRSPLAEFGSRT